MSRWAPRRVRTERVPVGVLNDPATLSVVASLKNFLGMVLTDVRRPVLSIALCLFVIGPSAALAQEAPTIRAVRLDQPLRVDGRLDDPLYTLAQPTSGFVQTEPSGGAPATERTDVWLSFDRDNVYVTMRAWESEPERMIVNEMRRDGTNITQNENVAFVLDTFHDRRNGIVFNINPIGGRMDGQISNEGNYSGDWNPVWNLAVGRFEGGWVAEAAIPFRSLRFPPGSPQAWGFNARRISRWKNEISYLAPVPNGAGIDGLFRVSIAASLTGIEVPTVRNLDLKPFVISDLTSDNVATPRRHNDLSGGFGLDAKYGVTPSLTADLTYRTDFAQVEADEQQVNLTRFSLFFPEKREFFLENQGIFEFGGANGRGNVPFVFYSRRIGLDRGQNVPIEGGGRLTGRVGQYAVGFLNIQTDSTDAGARATNFTVARIRRNILRRSSIGALFTGRSVATAGVGSNELFGVDGRFAFFQNISVTSYWAGTRTDTMKGDTSSYRAQLLYNGDRYGVIVDRLYVGKEFNPETGFIYRSDMNKSFGLVRFSPRPRRIRAVRKFTYQASVDYIDNATSGRLETADAQGQFAIDFQNSDNFKVTYDDWYERLAMPFAIANGVTVPVGAYKFGNLRTEFTLGQQRLVSGTMYVERGTFWDGHKTTVGMSGGRTRLSSQLAIEPSFSVNRVQLPFGEFTATLVSSRLTYTIRPLMFVSGLVQYNSSINQVSANVRLRWEYQPGSELFVVYNEGRDTLRAGMPGLQNRSLVVKLNRLLRM